MKSKAVVIPASASISRVSVETFATLTNANSVAIALPLRHYFGIGDTQDGQTAIKHVHSVSAGRIGN